MNAPLHLERLLGEPASPQAALPLATPGVQRWVWQGRYGAMLIEVQGEQVFVNGQHVPPHQPHPPHPTNPATGPVSG
jgi:hypothetical protein